MIMPSIQLDKPVVYRNSHAPTLRRFPSGALPPGLAPSSQLLDEPVVAPQDGGVAEPRRHKLNRIHTSHWNGTLFINLFYRFYD